MEKEIFFHQFLIVNTKKQIVAINPHPFRITIRMKNTESNPIHFSSHLIPDQQKQVNEKKEREDKNIDTLKNNKHA